MNVKVIAIGALLSLVSMGAMAGAVSVSPVSIDFPEGGSPEASGNPLAARNDKSDNTFIGCAVRYWAGQPQPYYGICEAEDANGVYAACTTTDAGLVDVIKGMSSFSYISFSSDNGNCYYIGTSTMSYFLPDLKSDKPSYSTGPQI